jgi:hypothetical protein
MSSVDGAFLAPRGCSGRQAPAKTPSAAKQKQATPAATSCHGLREKFHDKEGVDGSSPSDCSSKGQEIGPFAFGSILQVLRHAVGIEPFMELQL